MVHWGGKNNFRMELASVKSDKANTTIVYYKIIYFYNKQ